MFKCCKSRYNILPRIITLLLFWFLIESEAILFVRENHIGCFKDQTNARDLGYKLPLDSSSLTIEACTKTCSALYYRYAGLQNATSCFCGTSFGRYGRGECYKKCSLSAKDENLSICGGDISNTVYSTGIKVPGPPSNLYLTKSKEDSLSISWTPFNSRPSKFVIGYHIYVTLNKSFDTSGYRFTRKHIQLTDVARSTNILGLYPGSLYNVTVVAESKFGKGPGRSHLFWTEVGVPDTPKTPKLISHGHEDEEGHSGVEDGEIHIEVHPLSRNRNGPISGYRIIVIDETDPVPFHEESLTHWSKANDLGLKYWIAAEVNPSYFNDHTEFVVGDKNYYGEYFNYGPLEHDRDYHVTIGAVSTLNNVTKVSYAKVSHDQHSMENVVVFEFHDHHHHDHKSKHNEHTTEDKDGESDPLAVGLSIAIVLFGIILLLALALYCFIRRGMGMNCLERGRGSRGDIQELTTHAVQSSSNNHASSSSATVIASSDVETPHLGYDNNIANFNASASFDASVGRNESMSATNHKLDVLRSKAWTVPRNFLELTHEVVGRGKFGSVIKARVNNRGQKMINACVQVVPAKILDEDELKIMVCDLETNVRYGSNGSIPSHPHLLHLIGLYEDSRDTLFVVFEDSVNSLKQTLLDGRALIHYPVYASKNQRFSAISETQIFQYLIEAASGMEYLSNQNIMHRKLCASNIFVHGDQTPSITKVGGIGLADYSKTGKELDLLRWTAQEALKSKMFASKCDVWSFGILMWEAFTLGGTPYVDVKNRDITNRVIRGMRVPQRDHMTDDVYQLMLQCWQLDLDERPTFLQIKDELIRLQEDITTKKLFHINFSTREEAFKYEIYSNDLELLL